MTSRSVKSCRCSTSTIRCSLSIAEQGRQRPGIPTVAAEASMSSTARLRASGSDPHRLLSTRSNSWQPCGTAGDLRINRRQHPWVDRCVSGSRSCCRGLLEGHRVVAVRLVLRELARRRHDRNRATDDNLERTTVDVRPEQETPIRRKTKPNSSHGLDGSERPTSSRTHANTSSGHRRPAPTRDRTRPLPAISM